MENSDFALIAIGILTVGTFLFLPKGYRHYAVLVPLLILFVIVIIGVFQAFGFNLKTVLIIAAGLIMILARMMVARRM